MSHKLSLRIRKQVGEGIDFLRQGGLVAFPTDTVYGLGASSNLRQAVERIYDVKQRPRNMPLPLLLADIAQIGEMAHPVAEIVWRLARHFLPGALTLILPASKSVRDYITVGGTTVAVRVPAHPVPIGLVVGLGSPVIGTSANLSGKPSSLTADEVRMQFRNKIDLVIDGGRCSGSKESTIVDVTGEVPVVTREGAIPLAELERVCPNIVLEGD